MPQSEAQWIWFLFFVGGAFAGYAALLSVVLDALAHKGEGNETR